MLGHKSEKKLKNSKAGECLDSLNLFDISAQTHFLSQECLKDSKKIFRVTKFFFVNTRGIKRSPQAQASMSITFRVRMYIFCSEQPRTLP